MYVTSNPYLFLQSERNSPLVRRRQRPVGDPCSGGLQLLSEKNKIHSISFEVAHRNRCAVLKKNIGIFAKNPVPATWRGGSVDFPRQPQQCSRSISPVFPCLCAVVSAQKERNKPEINAVTQLRAFVSKVRSIILTFLFQKTFSWYVQDASSAPNRDCLLQTKLPAFLKKHRQTKARFPRTFIICRT